MTLRHEGDDYCKDREISAAEQQRLAQLTNIFALNYPEVRALRDKLAVADYVIENDRDLATLLARADDVLDAICERAGIERDRYPKPQG